MQCVRPTEVCTCRFRMCGLVASVTSLLTTRAQTQLHHKNFIWSSTHHVRNCALWRPLFKCHSCTSSHSPLTTVNQQQTTAMSLRNSRTMSLYMRDLDLTWSVTAALQCSAGWYDSAQSSDWRASGAFLKTPMNYLQASLFERNLLFNSAWRAVCIHATFTRYIALNLLSANGTETRRFSQRGSWWLLRTRSKHNRGPFAPSS